MSRIQQAGYRGDVALGSTITFLFNTYDVTGAPIAFAGSPTLAAYVNGGTTQLTAGLTLTQAFDGVVGLHLVTAVLSGANGYATASDIDIKLEGAPPTVDSVSVLGRVVGSCSIENRVSKADILKLLGTAWLTPGTAGTPDVNAKLYGGTTGTGRDLGASVLLSSGTGTGQLDFTSGVVKANLVQILAAAITGTAAQIVAAFTKWFNVASPTGTVNSLPDAVAGAAGGVAIVGSNMGTVSTVTGNVNGNVGGNVTGSVGSLATQAKADVRAEADAALVAAGVTPTVMGRLDVAVSTRMATFVYTAPDNAGIAVAAAAAVAAATILTDPMAELPVGAPPALPTPSEAWMLNYMALRNQVEIDKVGLEKRVFNNAGTNIAKKAISDDGSVYTEAKMVSG